MPPSVPSVSLPSPAPTTSTIRSDLPRPRAHPLRPGSAKEDQVRNFITNRINHITRRFVKKTGKATISVEVDSEVEGYKAMSELCKDLEDVINIVWLSGTRTFIPSLHACDKNDLPTPSQQASKYPRFSTSPASSTPGSLPSHRRPPQPFQYYTNLTTALPACLRARTSKPTSRFRGSRTA